MARNPETKGFVSWTDCMSVWNWFEWGFAVKIELKVHVACPPGEMYHKMYYELVVRDNDGQAVPLPSRVLGSFPSSKHQTVPGLLLGMLYVLEERLGRVRVWTEPFFKAPKVRALGVTV